MTRTPGEYPVLRFAGPAERSACLDEDHAEAPGAHAGSLSFAAVRVRLFSPRT